jgi:hypothetical protein
VQSLDADSLARLQGFPDEARRAPAERLQVRQQVNVSDARGMRATWPPDRNQAARSDHPLSVSNNDLGSSDCRTILNSVPRPTGS